MKRQELERTLRHAARLACEREFYLIGSQALHAYCRRPPAEVLLSQECDLYPKHRTETANLLDAQMGRGSPFARRNGFYADIVTPELASLPRGWERRLSPFRTGGVIAHCLEIHDLLISKLAAGRLKDLEFAGALYQLRLADPRQTRRRLRQVQDERARVRLRSRLQAVLEDLRQPRAERSA